MYSGRMTARMHRIVLVAGPAVVLAFAMVGVACAPSEAAEAPCPNNEALRAESDLNPETQLPLSMQLPDCRAYELVSPPYKEGYPVTVVQAIASDGDRMVVRSLGTFAELASQDGFGSFYEVVRTRSGWVTHNFTPVRAQFPVQEFQAASNDLTRGVWELREPSQSLYAKDLYVREPDGTFVKVGAMLPPTLEVGTPAGYNTKVPEGSVNYVGASSDLSYIVFKSHAPSGPDEPNLLWPGDTTSRLMRRRFTSIPARATRRRRNWSGSRARVGSSATAGPSSAGNRVICITPCPRAAKRCSLPLRAAVGVSAVDELYARRDGSETVAISEPTSSQCAACSTGARSAAEFQGASEDGSKAFFLTEQELFAGDTTMNLYEYDFENPEGEKIVRVSAGSAKPEVQGVARVSKDGSHVYFVARGVLTAQPDPSLPADRREAVAGADNLYVFERDLAHPQGHVAFVVTLCSGSGESGAVSDPQCHGSDAEDWGESGSGPVQATPEGRFLVFFGSSGNLTSGDTSAGRQIFEYDAAREELVRVSVGQHSPAGYECPTTHVVEEGYNCDGNTDESGIAAGIQAPPTTRDTDPTASETGLAVSGDGSYVFFTSPDGLTPGALDKRQVNGFSEREVFAQNVYEYHSTVGGSIGEGNVYLISDGRDVTLGISGEASGVELFGTDASGEDVFFSSSDQMVGQDTNTQADVYDARVDGGFPAPVSPVECAGEGCLPGPSAAPLFGSATSSSAASGANVSPPPVVSPPVVEAKTKPKPLTRTQKLANALRACRKVARNKRAACKARAEKRFGGKAKAKKSREGGGR